MLEAGVIGIARVVMHSKEHLAALIPSGAALMLNTIRWASEMRSAEELKLPPEGKSGAQLKGNELKMATQLIGDMTSPWKAKAYSDAFSVAVHALVNKKLEAGDTEKVTPLEDDPQATEASNVVDLTALLVQSLARRKPGASSSSRDDAKPGASGSPAVAKTAVAKRPTRKRA
jgi:DNA end-binding protein Ku